MSTAIKSRKASIQVLEVRSLTPADLELLRQPAARQPTVTTATLRDRHHHMAWLVALGKPDFEICAECRVSPSRLSQHKASPAFRDVVDRYRAEIESARIESAREFGSVAGEGMALAEAELVRRIKAEATDLGFRDLNRYATDRMDRFGYPKKTLTDSRSVNINFAANLEAAISRSRKTG